MIRDILMYMDRNFVTQYKKAWRTPPSPWTDVAASSEASRGFLALMDVVVPDSPMVNTWTEPRTAKLIHIMIYSLSLYM